MRRIRSRPRPQRGSYPRRTAKCSGRPSKVSARTARRSGRTHVLTRPDIVLLGAPLAIEAAAPPTTSFAPPAAAGAASAAAATAAATTTLATVRQPASLPRRSTASSRRSSGVVSEMRKKPSPLGPYAPPGRDHDGGLLEHVLAVRRRAVEALRDRRPDVDRRLRRLDVDADLAQRVDDEVAAARVERVHLALVAVGVGAQRRDAGELDGLEQPRVDVRLQPPVVLDRLGVADDRRAAPAGHVVALRPREDLDADVLGAGRRRGTTARGSRRRSSRSRRCRRPRGCRVPEQYSTTSS